MEAFARINPRRPVVRERPILFSAPMVRAILAGTKTEARRIVKPQPTRVSDGLPYGNGPAWAHAEPGSALMHSPYGQLGDWLWVRETWMPDAPRDGTWEDVAFFGCKGSPLSMIPAQYRTPEHVIHRASWDGHDMVGWKPSIHMPRWASRITLEVTGVRVERLQDISEVDAISEGVRQMRDGSECWVGREGPRGLVTPWPTAREAFRDLWQSINGPDSWNANPWMWVIDFKRITP